jgi:hypothetical protein
MSGVRDAQMKAILSASIQAALFGAVLGRDEPLEL